MYFTDINMNSSDVPRSGDWILDGPRFGAGLQRLCAEPVSQVEKRPVVGCTSQTFQT